MDCSDDKPGGWFAGRCGLGGAGREARPAQDIALLPGSQRCVRGYSSVHAHLWDIYDGQVCIVVRHLCICISLPVKLSRLP